MRSVRVFLSFCCALVLAAGCGGGGDGGSGPQPDPCSLTVTAPEAAATFRSGDPVNIRWDHTGDAAMVSIELWQDGARAGIISAGTDNDGFFPWTADVMGGAGGDFSILITALDSDGCTATSGVFSIANTAACDLVFDGVILPDTTFVEGDILPITWQSHDTLGGIDLQLWHGHLNPQLVGVIAEDTADDGEFLWSVDSFNYPAHEVVTDPSVYWVKLMADGIPGCEDGTPDFTISDANLCQVDIWMSPTQGAYALGDTVTIGYTINETEPGETVKIRLYAGADMVPGSFITPPGGELPADSTEPYQWVVTDYGVVSGTSNYRIRIIKTNDPYCWGESNNFAINE